MADVFTAPKRSEVMSRIRGRGNKTTELVVAALLREAGITGWRRHVMFKFSELRGDQARRTFKVQPDFVIRAARLAIFVDGCFWHACPLHGNLPVNRGQFWKEKLAGNVQRDKRAAKALNARGWSVMRIWEHELREPKKVAGRIRRRIAGQMRTERLRGGIRGL